jgi:hypothetical protein
MATRVMAKATKRAKETGREGNGDGGKSDGNSNEEGDGKSSKSNGDGVKEYIDSSGKSNCSGNKEGNGDGNKGVR